MPCQCSQRGSLSVLIQDEDGRLFVVPSRALAKLPDNPEWRTSGPVVPHHDITPVRSKLSFFDSLRHNMRTLCALLRILVVGLLLFPRDSSIL